MDSTNTDYCITVSVNATAPERTTPSMLFDDRRGYILIGNYTNPTKPPLLFNLVRGILSKTGKKERYVIPLVGDNKSKVGVIPVILHWPPAQEKARYLYSRDGSELGRLIKKLEGIPQGMDIEPFIMPDGILPVVLTERNQRALHKIFNRITPLEGASK